MPKTLTELTIFISCPADLAPERQIIEGIVAELNPLLKAARSVVLRVLVWDRDILPGIASDPQMVINNQIQGEYDIYIGLIGARFGTKTPRSGSGTEEEFEYAYRQYKSSPKTLRVLFYFKTSSDHVQQIDVVQLAKVVKFQKKLGKAGVLYSQFSNQDQLLKMIRNHLLQLVADEWKGTEWVSALAARPAGDQFRGLLQSNKSMITSHSHVTFSSAEAAELEANASDVVQGLIMSHQALKKITTAIFRWKGASERLVAKKKSGKESQESKYAFDAYGAEVLDLVSNIKKEVSIYRSSFGEAMDLLEAVASASQGHSEHASFFSRLIPLFNGIDVEMRKSRENIDVLRSQFSFFPNATEMFKRSKRKMLNVLAELNATTTINLDKIDRFRNAASQLKATKKIKKSK